MNILNFLNSRTMEKYLNDINYKLNAIEAAWIVNRSIEKMLYEKLEAFEWIIDNMPDCEFPKKHFLKFDGTVHDFLRKYIETINHYVNIFETRDSDYLYEYYVHDEIFDIYDHDKEFDGRKLTEEDCWSEIYDEFDDYIKDGCCNLIHLKKSKICEDYKCIDVWFTLKDRKLCKIEYHNIDDDKTDEYNHYIIDEVLESIFLLFPCPFKEGDLVTVNYHYLNFHKQNPEPFILEDNERDRANLLEHYEDPSWHLESGEMAVCGYFLSSNGCIYRDHGPNYMDLEYYNESFDNGKWILKATSECMKGRINPIQLLMLHQKYLSDYISKELDFDEYMKAHFEFPMDFDNV